MTYAFLLFNSSTPKLNGKYSRGREPRDDVGEYDKLRLVRHRKLV